MGDGLKRAFAAAKATRRGEPSRPQAEAVEHPDDDLLTGDGKFPVQAEAAPVDELEQAVIDLARETYDRFVMGGWMPPEAHDEIRERLQALLAAERTRVIEPFMHIYKNHNDGRECFCATCVAIRKLGGQ